MNATHLIGPWDHHPAQKHHGEGASFVIYPENTSEPLAEVLARDEDEKIAALMASAPQLLDELEKAHQIIRNALNLMTDEQKGQWARRNHETRCIGEGTTRANERRAIIQRAGGKVNS